MIKFTNNIMLIYRWTILAIALWNIVIAPAKNKGCNKLEHLIKGIFWVLWAIAIAVIN